VLFVLCLLASASAFLHEEEYQSLFTKWMSQHDKTYDMESIFHRYNTWKENLDYIHHSNQQNHSHTLAMNKFGDLTTKEFASIASGARRDPNDIIDHPPVTVTNVLNVKDPVTINWVTQGFVSPVKDQKQCGSCWAFGATGALEFLTVKQTGQMIPLSEQCLMDCDDNDAACQGGAVTRGMLWTSTNGIASEAAYPFTGVSNRCQPYQRVPIKVGHWIPVYSGNEDQLLTALQIQTISVQLSGGKKPFQFYAGGVLDVDAGDCGTDMDHALLLTGAGLDPKSGKLYWTVKNSWGSSWGESGYIRMVRGKNLCNIAGYPTYPPPA